MSIPLGACRSVDRTVVAIVRALDTLDEGGVLVLDEPTAALPPHEVDQLFATVKDLRSRGVATIYVSHRLDELFVLADRVSVLRVRSDAGNGDGSTRSIVASSCG